MISILIYDDLGEKGNAHENILPFFHPQTIIVKKL